MLSVHAPVSSVFAVPSGSPPPPYSSTLVTLTVRSTLHPPPALTLPLNDSGVSCLIVTFLVSNTASCAAAIPAATAITPNAATERASTRLIGTSFGGSRFHVQRGPGSSGSRLGPSRKRGTVAVVQRPWCGHSGVRPCLNALAPIECESRR